MQRLLCSRLGTLVYGRVSRQMCFFGAVWGPDKNLLQLDCTHPCPTASIARARHGKAIGKGRELCQHHERRGTANPRPFKHQTRIFSVDMSGSGPAAPLNIKVQEPKQCLSTTDNHSECIWSLYCPR